MESGDYTKAFFDLQLHLRDRLGPIQMPLARTLLEYPISTSGWLGTRLSTGSSDLAGITLSACTTPTILASGRIAFI